MAKFRKKPVIIEAWQWKGHNLLDAKLFCSQRALPQFRTGARNGVTGLVIPTLEGDMIAQYGDWIIKGIKDEFYPCKPSIFEQIYEKV